MKTSLRILIAVFALATPALAWPPSTNQSVSLEWTPNPTVNATNFILYLGTNGPGKYERWITVGNVTSTVIGDLMPGTRYYFAVTSLSTNGESQFSNVLTNNTDVILPGPILRIRGILQQACNILGPWEDLVQFGDTVCEVNENQYFRVRLTQELLP